MSKPVLKLGDYGPHVTGVKVSKSDRETAVVTLEGALADVEGLTMEDADTVADECFDLSGCSYTCDNISIEPTGDGFGRATLTYTMLDPEQDVDSGEPIRTTFRVDMEEVQYDLQDHPKLKGVRAKILAWLATDESERVDGDKYMYRDAAADELIEITEDEAIAFCKAFMAGIKTFNRYFPVIERISVWKNPPGLRLLGRSFTGGEVPFSSDIGRFSKSPISLNGFEDDSYFMSRDAWQHNENKTWTRTEQWTYTPEGAKGEHAWIYGGNDKSKGDK